MVLRRNIYKGIYLQRGSGFGAVLSGLFRFLVPFLKRGATTALKSAPVRRALSSAKKSAVSAAGNAAMDLVSGKNPIPQAKINLKTAKKDITKALLTSPTPSSSTPPSSSTKSNPVRKKTKITRKRRVIGVMNNGVPKKKVKNKP